METNRRGFLQALAGTAVAAMLPKVVGAPAIAAAPPAAAATNAVQAVRFSGPPMGGSFTLSFHGKATAAIAWDASAATIQLALDAADMDLTVTRDPCRTLTLSLGGPARPRRSQIFPEFGRWLDRLKGRNELLRNPMRSVFKKNGISPGLRGSRADA